MTIETWKPAVGFEAFYSVSNLGRVMRTGKGGAAQPGKIRALYPDPCGYLRVVFCVDSITTTKKVHRLVAENFIGPIPSAYTINHIDGVKTNNRVENLEIVTRGANLAHAFQVIKTRSNVGSHNPRATIDETTVRAIKNALSFGECGSVIARRHGITKYCVSDIKRGKTWAHVIAPEP